MGIFFFRNSAYFSRYCDLKFFLKILNRDVDRASRDRLDLHHIARGRRPRRLSGAEGALSSACVAGSHTISKPLRSRGPVVAPDRDATASPVRQRDNNKEHAKLCTCLIERMSELFYVSFSRGHLFFQPRRRDQ